MTLLPVVKMVPVSVPLNVPPPDAWLKVIVVLLVGFAGLPLASRDCTVTLKAVPAVPVLGTVEYASLVAAPATSVSVAKGVVPAVIPVIASVPDLVMLPLASEEPLVGTTLMPAQVILDLLLVSPSLADTVMVMVVVVGVTVCGLPPLKVRGNVPATVPTVTVTFAVVSNWKPAGALKMIVAAVVLLMSRFAPSVSTMLPKGEDTPLPPEIAVSADTFKVGTLTVAVAKAELAVARSRPPIIADQTDDVFIKRKSNLMQLRVISLKALFFI